MAGPTISGAKLLFATLHEAQQRISTSDAYTNQLSAYELQAKVQRLGDIAEFDYLENARQHARAWSTDEVDYISKISQIASARLNALGIALNLPKEIWLIKTTGGEEGGANGYTRGNTVFLNQGSLSSNLFRHELFHVATRHDTNLRDACYRTLGFEPIGPVDYPDASRISNPDAPALGHALTVTRRGTPLRVAIVLTGNRPYGGGSFFSYVSKRLLPVDTPTAPLLDFSQVTGLYGKIGRNTAYNIHQEEVCASHFELLLSGASSLPQPELIEELRLAMATSDQETDA